MSDLCNQILNIFTTRELSIGIWLIILFGVSIFKFNMKDSICNVLKSVFNPLCIKIYFILFSYWTIATFLLYKTNLWNISFLKDSVFWLLFIGVPFCLKVSQDKEYIASICYLLIR